MSEKNVIFFDRLPNGGAPKIPKTRRTNYRDDSDGGLNEDPGIVKSPEEQPKRLFIDRLRNENE